MKPGDICKIVSFKKKMFEVDGNLEDLFNYFYDLNEESAFEENDLDVYDCLADAKQAMDQACSRISSALRLLRKEQ